jgi:osmoprotectant transport system ATP-binding protein
MVELINVIKRYGVTDAVNGINLKINDGEFVVLVGTSGCGKTTTLKMINRLLEPTSGKIIIDGKNINSVNPNELRRNIGYVIQQIGLFPNMTILENVEIVPKLLKWQKEKSRQRALELLEMVNLPPDIYAKKYPFELSGGEQQRIGVLRALAAEPSLILMDEPFGALDPITREDLQTELKKLHRTLKKTFVFVTHDMSEAIKMADVIVFMNKGKIVQTAPPEEILRRPTNDFVKNFIGMHTASHESDMTVLRIMQQSPPTVLKSCSIEECKKLMDETRRDRVIVTDSEGRLSGIISAATIKNNGSAAQTVETLTEKAESVQISSTAKEAYNLMINSKADFLAAVDDNNRVAGVLTFAELTKFMAQALWGSQQ